MADGSMKVEIPGLGDLAKAMEGVEVYVPLGLYRRDLIELGEARREIECLNEQILLLKKEVEAWRKNWVNRGGAGAEIEGAVWGQLV